MKFCPKDRNLLSRNQTTMYLECRKCGYKEADRETENHLKTLLSEDTAFQIIKTQLEEKDLFYPYSLSSCKKNSGNIAIINNVAKIHPELCIIEYDELKKHIKIIINNDIKIQRIKESIVDKVSKLNTIKIENYNVFRLMNPYEGHDKDFYHGETGDKSRSDSNKFYDMVKTVLEKKLSLDDFIYLRGDQFAGGVNTYGIMLVSDKVLEYVIGSIESVTVSDGTNANHYWLEPFNPPDGSFIKLRILKEIERVKKELEREIKKLGVESQKL